eukprot:TRINITY_DN7916_c1_g1_i2.p3 TRINITY_DN7916_c1_g1~~TRINITY_DN7916_c1_g1_i2.p3  ORF type:complete len:108 (-),score=10.89 TRINITY_DN7916_c1_g1_i2:66-389(-)
MRPGVVGERGAPREREYEWFVRPLCGTEERGSITKKNKENKKEKGITKRKSEFKAKREAFFFWRNHEEKNGREIEEKKMKKGTKGATQIVHSNSSNKIKEEKPKNNK